ncbi:MAG: TlyA family RNA methyltransferase [Anaerolineae bacterium]|jgi:23S rRNA (cytidine1920-2'-O)/16S rRNA (cytidine1409-2'-O)-methyltransferase|nr:TlyA family RNA methyltransferase [Anaerolineae bacterium]MBT7190831.1 TlyA family RNA methyltransferase [Anaerolineae bacterium]MBT7991598.1 TlyA family RNA methyltransferase [Anaerolineae bacterium]
MPKIRLDISLFEQGLAESQELAQRLVIAGKVRVDGQLAVAPSQMIKADAKLDVDSGKRFVSRGGDKLAAALDAFSVNVQDLVCADAGASTGGFTDCLLQNGAAKVYAIDVGHGILAWELRNDPRVVVMEQTNARHVEKLDEPVDLVVIDASFISLKVLLPVIKKWLPSPARGGGAGGGSSVIALIKPQFEAKRDEVSRGKGVIRDAEIHKRVLREILDFAQEQGFTLRGLIRSPIQGPKGNVEFLVWLGMGEGEIVDQEKVISRAVSSERERKER